MTTRAQPIIIDIEASGFGAESYPIEIGIALQNNRRYCSLIRPTTDWIYWDASAQAIHQISRELLLRKGKGVREVAKQLNTLLQGQVVYSDGWVVDEPWLIRLFDAAGIAKQFYHYDLQTIMNEAQMAQWRTTRQQVEADLNLTRHRASNDAYVIQETYRRTWKKPKAAGYV